VRYHLLPLRGRIYELDGLIELPTISDPAARRSSFRQAIANLSRSATVDGPSPLEGIAPNALAKSVAVALEAGLFDDLDWLSPGAVGVALYELGAALPAGSEKRDIGRRVLARLHEGTAEVFAAIATRMALGSRKGLTGAAIKARVALLFAAPGTLVDAGPLAFAFVSRRELAREWIGVPSTGSLPSRRLASRMLERAAVVAARRSGQGDDFAPRVFAAESIATPLSRLLADREPLVWRHAAVARGVLSGVAPLHWKATLDSLNSRLTPTEWRRGAVSLVAAIATSPDRALSRARDLVASGLATRDPGLVATMVWGLPRAMDAEPEAAEELLDAIVDADAAGAAEGIAAIVRDVGGEAGRRAVATARAVLSDRIASKIEDPVDLLIARALSNELGAERGSEGSLRDSVSRAVQAFVESGAREAHAGATEALEVARVGLSTLEGLSSAGQQGAAIAQRTEVLLLRDLDAGLLEDSTLHHLVQLGRRSSDDDSQPSPLDDLHDRIGQWILSHESRAAGARPSDVSMSGRRLRALLHLLDTESSAFDEGDDRPHAAQIRARRENAASALLERLADDRRSPLHRTLCAALARALDAMVRAGTCDPVDVMLLIASRLDEASDVATLAEASMTPDLEGTLTAWAHFVRAASQEEALPLVTERRDSIYDDKGPPSSARTEEKPTTSAGMKVEAILELAASLSDDGSGRAESVRAVLVRVARALQNIIAAPSRQALVERASVGIDALAGAVHAYWQLEGGAKVRVLGEETPPASTVVMSAASRLAAMLGRIGDPSPVEAKGAVVEALGEIRRVLPPPLTRVMSDCLAQAWDLPLKASESEAPKRIRPPEEQLPAWLGPRRTLGGFFIVRPLGSGAASSVFIAKRIEERHEPNAEQFALKVPDYDGAAARSLSEQEFLAFFRAEASALLGLPTDPNLAHFVTFDLAARPKPILVMELIEGPTLERFVDGAQASSTRPNAARAFEILDGILAGLELMHKHSIGHLDVKPSNVILREGRTPTLVDFGLAGRHIRPGCATGPYGAPEVWGVVPEDFTGPPSPLPADVYAFGALAFEVLTGRTLFDGDTEVAVISKHLTHDGRPAGIETLGAREIVDVIQNTLRHDPRKRWTVSQVRSELRRRSGPFLDRPWPLK